uniref:Nucleotide-diphospho-sugar transferase domain-containing protein n=1 Tax=Alexandrium monilatum TaxID=311494 RepID=A0A7S4T9U7_9DINO
MAQAILAQVARTLTDHLTCERAMRCSVELALLSLLLALAWAGPPTVCSSDSSRSDGMSLLQRRSHQTSPAPALAEAVDAMHFIYTVGCNHYQLVQAVVLDHTWREAGNAGRLTRIVVNCEDEKSRAMLDTSPLRGDRRYAVFFSEGDLMEVPGKNDSYPARGRPYAIMQWMKAAKPREPVVAILDPDFVFVQPISSHPDLHKVRPGQMLAQKYDLGKDFIPGFAEAGEKTPVLSWDEAVDHYATGPPWVLHRQDLETMLPDWGRYTDSWPKSKGLLREQDAFAMAALKHKVPSIGQNVFMVSNPIAWHEAWSEKGSAPESWKPYVLHYCQSYAYGSWFFYKSLIADDYYAGGSDNALPGPLRCGAPLLQEAPPPPADEADRSSFMRAWMLWKLFPPMNRAFAAYRERYCPTGKAQEAGGRVVRTMSPRGCNGRTTTRYLAALGSEAAWTSTGAQGDDPCSEVAQTLPL